MRRTESVVTRKEPEVCNSALEPKRCFSKASAKEQILVRMDDKLSCIQNRQNDEDEDVFMDLAGYLILYLVARDKNGN